MIPSLGDALIEFLGDQFGYVGADAVVLVVFSPPTVNLDQRFHVKSGETRVPVRGIVAQFRHAVTSAAGNRPVRAELNGLFHVEPVKLCGSSFAQNWRPRCYWTSWGLVCEDAAECVKCDDYVHYRLPMRLPPPEV
eukprot:6466662-Amphidinium_carterae.2